MKEVLQELAWSANVYWHKTGLMKMLSDVPTLCSLFLVVLLIYEIPQTSIIHKYGAVKGTGSYISMKNNTNAASPLFWTEASY